MKSSQEYMFSFCMNELDDIQEQLIAKEFPYSKSMRKYAWALVLIWILGCDLLIVVYGIQFDLSDTLEVAANILGLYNDAAEICSSDPYMALDYVDRIQYDSQTSAVENAPAPFGGIFEGVDGSTKWLLSVLSALLMGWFINMPASLFAGAVFEAYNAEVIFVF